METWVVPIIIDVIALICMLVCIFNGFRRGILYSLLSFLGCIVSAALAFFLAKLISPLLAGMTADFWEEWLYKNSYELLGVDSSLAAVALQTQLPEAVQELLAALGATIPDVVDNAATALVENMFIPLTTVVLECVFFLLFAFLLTFILYRLIRRTNHMRPSIVGSINSLLGALLGVAHGAVIVFILTTIASILITVSANDWTYFNSTLVGYTYLFNWFYQLNPLCIIV